MSRQHLHRTKKVAGADQRLEKELHNCKVDEMLDEYDPPPPTRPATVSGAAVSGNTVARFSLGLDDTGTLDDDTSVGDAENTPVPVAQVKEEEEVRDWDCNPGDKYADYIMLSDVKLSNFEPGQIVRWFARGVLGCDNVHVKIFLFWIVEGDLYKGTATNPHFVWHDYVLTRRSLVWAIMHKMPENYIIAHYLLRWFRDMTVEEEAYARDLLP